jgi:hypothetical protein
MTKKVLILSSSPRRNGNSDTLCNEFMRGAVESGHTVEKIFLRDKTIHYCTGCSTCSFLQKPCPQKDDAAEVIEKMVAADVIVLGTPVYFYAISAQMKTLIDRCCGRYTEMTGKEFYFRRRRRRRHRPSHCRQFPGLSRLSGRTASERQHLRRRRMASGRDSRTSGPGAGLRSREKSLKDKRERPRK